MRRTCVRSSRPQCRSGSGCAAFECRTSWQCDSSAADDHAPSSECLYGGRSCVNGAIDFCPVGLDANEFGSSHRCERELDSALYSDSRFEAERIAARRIVITRIDIPRIDIPRIDIPCGDIPRGGFRYADSHRLRFKGIHLSTGLSLVCNRQ